MDTVMKIKDVSKIYGSRDIKYKALNDINLDIKDGELIAIMGPSGAGKTTLLNLIATIDKPTNGEIIYKGRDVVNLKKKALTKYRKEELGFVFQDFNLLDNMLIEDNIALPLSLRNINHKEIGERVGKISAFFGIENQLKKYPYELSGGQKQRAAASRALITNPKLLLADEPTGALDSKASAELLKSFVKMNEDFKTTIVMVTHDAFAASYCKRVIFLKDGCVHIKINKENSRREFYKRIIDLLGSMGGAESEYI